MALRPREGTSFSDRSGHPLTGQPLDRWNIAPAKARELIALLEADGWHPVRMKGSHRQFPHLTKKGTVTVAGKPGVDMPSGTSNGVLKQAGVEEER